MATFTSSGRRHTLALRTPAYSASTSASTSANIYTAASCFSKPTHSELRLPKTFITVAIP